MPNYYLICIAIFVSSFGFAQDSDLSIEANYPIPVGDNFLAEDSYGIIDLGIKYRFVDADPVRIGLSLNGGVIINNANQNTENTDFMITHYLIQPKAFAELNLKSVEKLHPFLGVGYTFMSFQYSGSRIPGESDSQSGLGVNLGVAYDISQKVFVQAQYDYTKLNVDDVPDTTYNTSINLLKIGIGLRF